MLGRAQRATLKPSIQPRLCHDLNLGRERKEESPRYALEAVDQDTSREPTVDALTQSLALQSKRHFREINMIVLAILLCVVALLSDGQSSDDEKLSFWTIAKLVLYPAVLFHRFMSGGGGCTCGKYECQRCREFEEM